MKNIFNLIKENRDKIEKFSAKMFFLSSLIFGIPLILSLILIYITNQLPVTERTGGVLAFIILLPPAIISGILSIVGVVCCLLSLRKSLLWLAFLNILLMFQTWLLICDPRQWMLYSFTSLFFFFLINAVFFYIK